MTDRPTIDRQPTGLRRQLQWKGAYQFAVIDRKGRVIIEKLPNGTTEETMYTTRRRAENALRRARKVGIEATIVERRERPTPTTTTTTKTNQQGVTP